MERKTRLRRILRRKRVKRAIKAYGNYIAAGSKNKVYGWEVSTVKEYEKPMALETLGIKRAPQSWQYVR